MKEFVIKSKCSPDGIYKFIDGKSVLQKPKNYRKIKEICGFCMKRIYKKNEMIHCTGECLNRKVQ